MKLVEIAGHLIDPGAVTHVGPIQYGAPLIGNSYGREVRLTKDYWFFNVCAEGASIWVFDYEKPAESAREALGAAIESEDYLLDRGMPLSCCVSWPKHGLNEKGGHLHGKDEIAPFPSDPPFSDYKPSDTSAGNNGAMGASDALVGVEAEPAKCRLRINTMRGESFVVDVKEMKPE